jgi:hypothetical protein
MLDGLDGIPSSVTRCCSKIEVSFLKIIFNFSSSQLIFSKLSKQAVIVPVSKNCNISHASNYRPIAIVNNFSKVLLFIIHVH